MGVWRDFVSIRHLQANGVISRCSHGIAFDHCQLCSRWDERRSRSPFHLIWRKGVLRPQRCGEKRADRKNSDEKRKFHRTSYKWTGGRILSLPSSLQEVALRSLWRNPAVVRIDL